MPAGPPGLEPAALAHIDIQDAPVTVVSLAGSLDSETPEQRRAIHEAWKSWAARQGRKGGRGISCLSPGAQVKEVLRSGASSSRSRAYLPVVF